MCTHWWEKVSSPCSWDSHSITAAILPSLPVINPELTFTFVLFLCSRYSVCSCVILLSFPFTLLQLSSKPFDPAHADRLRKEILQHIHCENMFQSWLNDPHIYIRMQIRTHKDTHALVTYAAPSQTLHKEFRHFHKNMCMPDSEAGWGESPRLSRPLPLQRLSFGRALKRQKACEKTDAGCCALAEVQSVMAVKCFVNSSYTVYC